MSEEPKTLSSAARELIESHLGLVEAIARELIVIMPRGLELAELVSLGRSGLVEAAMRYDPRRNASFSTFATYRVRGAIYDGLRRSKVIRRGDKQRLQFQAGADAYLETRSEEKTADNNAELACLEDMVSDVAAIYFTSLEEDASKGQELASMEANADERLQEQQLQGQLKQARQGLDPKEAEIIRLHYDDGLSLTEAGHRLGISKAWASRLHAKAVRSLAAGLRVLSGEAAL